ncbi:DUF1198 family protein [Frateuria edaphi]|uniref:DUF1198 family protein n=1 Tax=Frateuria edaphi TaxID=2898793 RepID=UPI001E5FE0C5|nr:DUF1198 family protein [Frateuria edaphi]UGB47235.1 DUF1198 family protein [Frateuria edaphi]
MWWGVGATIIVVATWAAVRAGTKDVRYVGMTVGKALRVKAPIIEQVLLAMGQERCTLLANQIRSWPQSMIQTAVSVVFVYQIVKNKHPGNVEWWRARIEEKGLSSNLDLDDRDLVHVS